MKFFRKLTFTLSLLLLLSLIILLKGCGKDDQAPYGSSIIISPVSVPVKGFSFAGTYFNQPYRVTLLGPDGKPMNGMDVIVDGGFAVPNDPQLYTFFLGNVPQDSGFRCRTNYSGICNFSVRVPSQVDGGRLWDPVNDTFTAATLGTGLPSGIEYCYMISALNDVGETLASAETCATPALTQNAINVTWPAISGATEYRIYRGASGSETLMDITPPIVGTSYLDINGTLPGVTTTPLGNSTQLADPAAAPTLTTNTSGGSLTDSTHYCYRVSAINDVPGETLASPEQCIDTGVSGGTNTVTVSWVATPGATGYNIYGRTTAAETLMSTVSAVTTFLDVGPPTVDPDLITDPPITNSTELDDPTVAPTLALTVAPGLTPGLEYCYRVSALDSFGSQTAASASTCITLSGSENVVNVNWFAVVGATGYNIYGRALGNERLLNTVIGANTTTYQDTGTDDPAGQPLAPDINNSSRGLILNSFHDDITVSSGSATVKSTLSFNE